MTVSSPDLLLGPIVGSLSHNSAKLWGRVGSPVAAHGAPLILRAWLARQPDLSDAWLAGESLPLSAAADYCGVAPVAGLQPNQRYYYALTLSETHPRSGHGWLPDGAYPSFRTFPTPGQPASFAFAFGSCFRRLDDNSGHIFYALEGRRQIDDLRFIMQIGDQIYADQVGANGLDKVAESLEEYRRVYAHTWALPSWRQLLYQLPAFMVLDDHEVDDDWYWKDRQRRVAYITWLNIMLRSFRPRAEREIPLEQVQNALQAYWEHQGLHAPDPIQALQRNAAGQFTLLGDDPGSFAYTFEYGQAAFFVMDTRTMRVRSRREQIMLCEGQWQALQDWLLCVQDTHAVKFLVSSASFFYRMSVDIFGDRWSGLPRERNRLIRFLANHGLQGVYFLTGDLHAGYAYQVELSGPDGGILPVWEFCATPFDQQINWPARYTCWPLRNKLIRRQSCKFVAIQNNFGLVRVDFANPESPVVRFELYGEDGQLLGQAG